MEETLVFERRFDAPPATVWKALTDKEEMRRWYFHLEAFRPEAGFAFSFVGGPPDGIQYVHRCVVTEAVPERVLAHTWEYEGYSGSSTVRWELTPDGDGTLLRLSHTGIGSFPADNPDLDIANFRQGWTEILHTHLRGYFEREAQ
ncbi:MAG: SRPBCC domain-containing protein [Chitinophagaceae bacterium]|nr:MAG: SRPBCC domain-containing protein [Chitinophagaceae bacterium]